VRGENKLRTFGLIFISCVLLGFLAWDGGLGATSLYGFNMKIILFFLVFFEVVFCQDKVYSNPYLGISFSYSEYDYSPFTDYDTLTTNFTDNWNNFISKIFDVTFKYPTGVSVLEDKMEYYYGQSINDSAIYIGYKDTSYESKLCTFIIIFKSSESFNEIAENQNFEFEKTSSDSGWITLGYQSMNSKATYFKGKNFEGLRGHSLVKFSQSIGDGFRTFIVFNGMPQIVMVFDPTNAVGCSYSEELENILWENNFFNIASTIEIIKK